MAFQLLAPVALFTVYGNLLMPVAVWLNTKTHDDGEVHVYQNKYIFYFVIYCSLE